MCYSLKYIKIFILKIILKISLLNYHYFKYIMKNLTNFEMYR